MSTDHDKDKLLANPSDSAVIVQLPAKGAPSGPSSLPLSPLGSRSSSPSSSFQSLPLQEGISKLTQRRAAASASTTAQMVDSIEEEIQLEHERLQVLIEAREVRINRLWWAILIGNAVFWALWVIIYLARWSMDIDTLVENDIVNYDYSYSFFDLFIVVTVRFIAVLLGVCATLSDEHRNRVLTTIAYWCSFASFFLAICKAVLIESYSQGGVVAIVVFALIFETTLLVLEYAFAPLPAKDEWDAYETEEQQNHAKRKKQHEEACARAAEVAATLTGEALRVHNEKEAERVASYEYVEKVAQRARMAARANQSMRLRELCILLKPYFWPAGCTEKSIVFLAWGALIGSKVCSILAPLYVGYATDMLVNEGRVPWGYITLFAGLTFLSQGLKQLQTAVYLKVKQQSFLILARYCFEHVLHLSIRWHTAKSMGRLMRLMSRAFSSLDTLTQYSFMYLLPSLVESLVVFILFYVRFQQPLLSVILLCHLVLYITVTVLITIQRKQYRKLANKHDEEYTSIATESLVVIDTIKATATEGFIADRYSNAVREFQKHNTSTQVSLSLLNSVQSLIIQSCLLLGLFVTGYQVVQGAMSIGDFSSVVAYVSTVFAPLSFLGTIYDMIVQSFVDMKQLCDLLAEQPDVKDAPDALPIRLADPRRGATIEFRDVCFSYSEQAPDKGLRGVSFTVAPGTTTAIVGTTGAGKSTIGKLLLRFYDVTGGGIFIDGMDIRDVTQHSLRNVIGVVPQDTTLFNDTILYNVRYGRQDATMDEVESACRDAQILPFILSLPAQWETKVGERGLRLSGGEKQRVAIARCLLRDPPIVLLDEATSALDSVKEREIQDALRRLENGRSSVVIAHRLSTIMHAEQIIVLDHGKIAEKGTHAELLALNGKYAALWNQQSQATTEVVEKTADKLE